MIKRFIYCILLALFSSSLPALDTGNGHRAAITSLISGGNSFISSAEDGFIEIWNPAEKNARRFQLTPYKIQMMIKNPSKEELCIVEAAGIDDYRLSVWNYISMEKIFSVNSKEPVNYINYSAGGSFIIAAGFDGKHLALLDSVTGEIKTVPDIPAGFVTLAATGRAERNMLIYQMEHEDFSQPEGQILYVDINSASVTGCFQAPGSILKPIIFGNNRFIAGINWEGLLLVDASSGAVLDCIEELKNSALLCSAGEGFFYFNNDKNELYEFSVDSAGIMEIHNEYNIPPGNPVKSIAFNENAALAASNGNIYLIDKSGKIIVMEHEHQTHITEIAVSDSSIAVLTEQSNMFFLPLDYRLLERTRNITTKIKNGYNKITAIPVLPDNSGRAQRLNKFILWQNANIRYFPEIVNSDHSIDEYKLNFLLERYPIRSISMMDKMILVLDNAGNVSVSSYGNAKKGFSFSSVGAIDAAFIDSQRIIICRSVMRGNSPFLIVNHKTGETVPVAAGARAQAGIMAYTAPAGHIVPSEIYAAAVERDNEITKTAVYAVSAAPGGEAPRKILEYPGEDILLSITHSKGNPAIVCGGQGAAIYSEETVNFERSPGLPVRLIGCEEYIISLDSEGSICWHENTSGKLLAVFKTYGNRWILRTGAREVSGGFS
ncbi:MAG: hypothetical protein LBH16_04800 [Treponema sp.]|jgi:WD40 repeat protein|nr:hypothetical protein [Treponema sp.]